MGKLGGGMKCSHAYWTEEVFWYLHILDDDGRVELEDPYVLGPDANLELDEVGRDLGAVDGVLELLGQSAVVVVVEVGQEIASRALDVT